MAVSFSVIVPVYNKAQYVKQCVDSLLDQTHKDFEVLAINDGSTDDSLQILESYTDKRLTIISCDNSGVSNARNIGIANAKKEYVTFVDADDYVRPNYLEEFDKEIGKTSCDVLISGLTKISPNGEIKYVKASLAQGIIQRKDFQIGFVGQVFEHEGILGYVAAKCVKRELLYENKIQFNTSLKLAEDLDFWISCYAKANVICISHQTGYLYRQDAENSSSNSLTPQHISQIGIWERILADYAIDEQSGRVKVLEKINGIMESCLLDSEEIGLGEVSKVINQMCISLDYVLSELKMCASGMLQHMILNQRNIGVWFYLLIRALYHKLR